jgi:hypothetical protein
VPRPPRQPTRDQVPEEDRELYDTVVRRFAPDAPAGEPFELGGYFGTLLNSPPFARPIVELGRLVRLRGHTPGSYSHADREWVDQVLCVDWKTNVVMPGHLTDAVAVGVRLEAIEALREGREEDLTEDERFLTAYIRQCATGTVTDESWERMVERLGVRGAVEYTLFVNFLQMIIRNMQAFGVHDPSAEEVDGMIRDLKEGRTELPDVVAAASPERRRIG